MIKRGEVKVPDHSYDELADDKIVLRDIVANVTDAVVVEDCPDYPKGPCVLVLERNRNGEPIHVVWGDSEECFFTSSRCHRVQT